MIKTAFIIGSSRSGTSVMAEALGRHDLVTFTQELHYYNLFRPANTGEDGAVDAETLLAQLKAIQFEERFFEVKNGTPTDLPAVTAADLPPEGRPLLPAFFADLAAKTKAQVIVEQTPMNLYYRDDIRRDFPDTLFILMRRDPRAIFASQKDRWKVGALGARTHPERDILRYKHAGHLFIQMLLLRKTARAVAEASQEADVDVVIYEDLVRAPETALKRLCDRLGLTYDPDMTQVGDDGSSHIKSTGGSRGFDPSRLETWRKSLTPTEIWLTEKIYGAELTLPKTGMRPRIGEFAKLVLGFPRALAMALYYSTDSYGNLLDAVKRRLF